MIRIVNIMERCAVAMLLLMIAFAGILVSLAVKMALDCM